MRARRNRKPIPQTPLEHQQVSIFGPSLKECRDLSDTDLIAEAGRLAQRAAAISVREANLRVEAMARGIIDKLLKFLYEARREIEEAELAVQFKDMKELGQYAGHCAGCRQPFGALRAAHVDKYHRLTPLCGECYADSEIARATASADDPKAWWKSVNEVREGALSSYVSKRPNRSESR